MPEKMLSRDAGTIVIFLFRYFYSYAKDYCFYLGLVFLPILFKLRFFSF